MNVVYEVSQKVKDIAAEPWQEWNGEGCYRKVLNPKKNIRLKNRTKYFIADEDKTHVTFESPDTYNARQQKIEGYELRLFYEYKWHEDNNGQTYFYTLTYNDAHMPTYMGRNCFDYEDLRDLLTGGFRKKLLRQYGTTFKYFVGAELGDGKGERGMHNNPHYHILFFLHDAENPRYPYKKILPEQFRHLVREYWQGFDEDTDGAKPYQEAKYGIAKEGDFIGLVQDFHAIQYVAKYVCKDVGLKNFEKDIRRKRLYKYTQQYKDTFQSYMDFFHEPMYAMFNIPLDAKHTKWELDDRRLLKRLANYLPIHISPEIFETNEWLTWREDIIKSAIAYYQLWSSYFAYVELKCTEKVNEDIKEYRNRYCNKARISQGVGKYALNFIEDILKPTVPIPSKKGIKNRPIGLYLYRQMYTEIYTDIDGSKTRILNQLGIDYKVANIQSQIDKMAKKTEANLKLLQGNNYLYNEMLESDVNTDLNVPYSRFISLLEDALKENNITNICKRYAEYKLVYEDRFTSLKVDTDSGELTFPDINPVDDIRRFLTPSAGRVRRSSNRLDIFLESTLEDYIPYYAHPYFLRYACIFTCLNLVADYFSVQEDDIKEDRAREQEEIRRFHKQLQLKQYYNNR